MVCVIKHTAWLLSVSTPSENQSCGLSGNCSSHTEKSIESRYIRAGVPVFNRIISNPAPRNTSEIKASGDWYSPSSIIRPDGIFSPPIVTRPRKKVPVVKTIDFPAYTPFIIFLSISIVSTVSNAIVRFLYSFRIFTTAL